MFRNRWVGLLALWALAWPLSAAAGDGALVWRTIDTPHFQVHYPRGLEPVAFRTARLCEEAHRLLTPLMGHVPDRRVQVVVSDFGDSANGSATALPYPRVNVFAAPPSLDGNLNDYDDWLRLLVFHEYVHILQLDNVSGLPAFFNALFGRLFAPNQALPSFVLEGEAVWAESLTSERGRIRSAVFRGVLRAQALAGRLHGMDAVVHAPQDWPGANVWYMYGGHFMDWIARNRGTEVIAKVHEAAADELIPFALNRSALEATGQTYTELFRAWQADLTARARAEKAALAAEGLTPLRLLTTTGRVHRNPRFLPDGDLLALVGSDRKPSGIYRRRPGSALDTFEGMVFETHGTDVYDLCGGGRALVYDEPNFLRGAYARNDLFTYDFGTRQRRRVTTAARIREPACAPDGSWAAAVQIVDGRTRLVRVDLTDGAVTPLLDPGELNQVAFPTVSRDGRHVVVSRVSQREGRDLVALDLATGAVQPLTRDEALELHPTFSHDGRWLLYASDRAGVFDIYARAWPDGPTRRATRVVTGALDPALSPDGRTLTFRLITADGYDLAEADFDPEALLPVPPPADEPPIRAAASAAPLPDRDYDPLETLWPVAWSPAFSFSSAEDTASRLGIELEASDAASHHIFIGSFAGIPEEDAISVSLNYAYRRLTPNFNLGFNHTTRTREQGAFFGSAPQPFRERVTRASTSLGFPFSRSGHGASFGVGYGLDLFSPAENPDPVHEPRDASPRMPGEDTFAGSLTLSARYSHTDSYVNAISTEQGRSVGVTARVRHPNLGGEVETAEIFFDYAEFVPLWWRHVLALRLTTAFGRGPSDRRVLFSLSGPQERNVLIDALDGIIFGNNMLRGYPSGTEVGDRYVLVTAEYRLPLLDFFGGPSSVPLFLRRLKLALFTDWGQANEGPLDPNPLAYSKSVGAELITESTLGWRLPVSVRTGVAQGFDDAGELQIYFFLGSWF